MFVPKCLTLLLIVSHATDVFGRKRPTMKPDRPEIHIKEGERLEIACYGSKPLDFYYPNNNTEFITTSPAEINEYSYSGQHQTNLVREKAVHGDTGYYGCAENDVDVTPGVYNEPDVKWTYVYVKSTENGFISVNEFEFYYPIVGSTLVLPCRPNSPDYQVKLFVNYEETEMNEKYSFDPRVGFTIHDLILMDSGPYRCEIERGEDIDEALYNLRVENAPILVPPRIAEEPLRHVILGQTLRVNCSTDVGSDQHFSLNWTTPHQSPRISINTYSNQISGSSDEAISELQIKDVSEEDAGEYTCTVFGTHDKRETKKNITVHDPSNTYMKLKPVHENMFYNAAEGDEVTWVITVDAFPQPDLQWYFIHDGIKPVNLRNTSRHQIINKTDQMVLKLKKLKVTDMGIYSLQATNDYGIETLNFTLEVTSHPLVEEFPVHPYYLPNTREKFDCHAVAFPAPNITWSFVPLNGMDTIILRNATHDSEFTKTISTVTLMTNTSGSLNCSSCNIHGCDSVVQMIFLSEVKDGFGIIPPEQKDVTAGDDLILACAASVYNYTDSIHWFDENGVEIIENERVHINRTVSPFTYQSILHINPVEKSDQQTYTCRGIFAVNEEENNVDYFLEVHNPLAPYFLNDTNLNQTENTYSPGIDSVQNLALKCYVKGMPEPRITWLKDGVPIDFDDETTRKDYTLVNKNQELYIEQLLERLSGTYTCRAWNREGTIESFQKITVKGKDIPQWLTVVIILLVVLVVILVIFFSIKVHREKVMRKQLMEAGLTHFEEGALECLNPDLTVDDQAELLPYDKKWEFPRERLKFGKQLGHGAFGVVMKAEAQGIVEGEDSTTVAVKMVKRSTESIHIRALASELKIMVHLGKHLNVVNLLGACTKNIAKRELLVIVEYCRYGNLHNYLLRHRAEFINQIDPATGKIDLSIGSDLLKRSVSVSSNNSLSTSSGNGDSNGGPYSPGPDSQGVSMSPDGMVMSNNSIQPAWRSNYRGDYKDHNLKPICTQDLLSWAFQVARGMEYLSQRKVLHGDLAARNILLAEDNIVKICDFGLAKTMYKDDNYKKKGDAPLPIKWMAIESIRDRVFSTQSDIWSFGIVLWEFFTLAKTPYPGMEAEKQYQRLVEGYRMEQPEFATEQIYDIMFQCWKAKPTLRPTFSDLVENIGSLLDDGVKMHYVDLNTPYLDMNTMIKNDYLTMMSAPDHDALSSPTRDYVNTPCLPQTNNETSYICMSPSGRTDDSDIFSPRISAEKSHFEFPTPKMSAINSDSDSEAIEISPMLKNSTEDDPYLKPINVHERRAEFSRQRQALKTRDSNGERDSGYCNTPHNIRMFDVDNEIKDEIDSSKGKQKKDYISTPAIIRTQDNYVNMPRNKNDYKKDTPDSFTNPSYVLIDKNFPQSEV